MKYLIFLYVLGSLTVNAQIWHDPAKESVNVIEGQGWPGEVAARYDRLPARAEGLVRQEVWNLSRMSAGMMIRFRSDAASIQVRYAPGNSLQAYSHMPATGVSGLDLYAIGDDGTKLWAAGKYKFGDTIEYTFQVNPGSREYRLYLPLFNVVKWLQVGVADSSHFEFLPVRASKPVLIYGTSIAHGACASRPGMAWTSILQRKLDRPVINLGFSGNGRMEKEMVGLLPEIDAEVYVLDCLPNLVPSVGIPLPEIKERYLQGVKLIRARRTAPIVLTAHAGYTDGGINETRGKAYKEVNALLDEVYKELKAGGVKGVYLLSKDEIGMGLDMMVDGTHPNDLGMERYAEAYEKKIRQITEKK
jgi:lysophospholipase L1-like esterase